MTAVPTVPVVGPVTATTGGVDEIAIEAVLNAFAPFPSVAVALTTKVPLTLYVTVKLAPVPVAGVPPGAVHANVYGAVPPVAEAVKVTAAPTVPEAGPVTVTASGSGLIVTVVSRNAFALFVSVIVTLIVLLPLTE